MGEGVGIELSLGRRGGRKPERQKDTLEQGRGKLKGEEGREKGKENIANDGDGRAAPTADSHPQVPVPILRLPWPETSYLKAENMSAVSVVSAELAQCQPISVVSVITK